MTATYDHAARCWRFTRAHPHPEGRCQACKGYGWQYGTAKRGGLLESICFECLGSGKSPERTAADAEIAAAEDAARRGA